MNEKARKRIVFGAGLVALTLIVIALLLPGRVGGGPSLSHRTRSLAKELSIEMEVYREDFGSYPMGQNRDLVRVLRGDNPKNRSYFVPEARLTNHLGEVVDAWRTPYRFEIRSTNTPLVISAGPNKKFGDSDDIFEGGYSVQPPETQTNR